MKQRLLFLFCIFIFCGSTCLFSQGGKEDGMQDNTLMFRCAPNPCSDKCLIRTYLPESDPYSAVRILNSDSVLVKEIPMAAENGVGSAVLEVSDLENGTYYYQLFYKGEIYFTDSMKVRH